MRLAGPFVGAERVATYVLRLARHGRLGRLRPLVVNGQPGFATMAGDGKLTGVAVLDIADQAVQTIRCVRNPDKLRHRETEVIK